MKSRITRITEGLTEETVRCIIHDAKQSLSKAFHQVFKETAPVVPPEEKWFEAFRLCPIENTKVVILGQDPYIKPGEAHGLSFSTRATTVPPSLKNIYKCLLWNGLIQQTPPNGDLSNWARQGVLLLNRALTTRLGKSNAHAGMWKPYTDAVMAELAKRDVLFILLGGAANTVSVPPSRVFSWGHPSPLNAANRSKTDKNNFIYCDVFKKVNEALHARGKSQINWDPEYLPLPPADILPSPAAPVSAIQSITPTGNATEALRSTDNVPEVSTISAIESSTPDIPAGILASHITSGNHAPRGSTPAVKLRSPLVSNPEPGHKCPTCDVKVPIIDRENTEGPFPPDDRIWVFTDGGATANGKPNCRASFAFYIAYRDRIIYGSALVPARGLDNKNHQPSNNRGEIFGVMIGVHCLLYKTGVINHADIVIVSDSSYTINCLSEWMDGWIKKNALADKKNLDILRPTHTMIKSRPMEFIT